MSSTNRGRSRNRQDNYPTSAWCVHRALEAIPLPAGDWLEPAAGNGAIIRAARTMPKWTPVDYRNLSWTAVELRLGPIKHLERLGDVVVLHEDFLATSPTGGDRQCYKVAITNPPFSKAREFAEMCMEWAEHTVLLLRLNFLASEERALFLRQTHPDVYVLPNRPSFLLNGKTDSIEYAWFHWHDKSTGAYTILSSTPIEERRRK